MLRLLSVWSLLLCSVRRAGAVEVDRRIPDHLSHLIPPPRQESFSCEIGVEVGNGGGRPPISEALDIDKYFAKCREACTGASKDVTACYVEFGNTSEQHCAFLQKPDWNVAGCLYFREDAKGCAPCPGPCVQQRLHSPEHTTFGLTLGECRDKCSGINNAGFLHMNHYIDRVVNHRSCVCLAAAPIDATPLAYPYLTCFVGTGESSTSIIRAQEENSVPTGGAHNEPPTATTPSEKGTSGKAPKCPRN